MVEKIKYYLGPMSKNVVDAILDYNINNGLTFGFIPSRRQVEYDGGYVNNWTNESFSGYVKARSKNTIIQRDHGGPEQGYNDDDGRLSFSYDAKYFDLIHVDPWKKYPNIEDGSHETIDIIRFCLDLNPDIQFEVGTEEAIRSFSVNELELFLKTLELELSENEFQKIKYVVIQSGVGLNLCKMKNTGNYNKDCLYDMIQVVKKYNKLTKEHNADYLSYREIQDRFSIGLDAINIAPELGQIETCAIIEILNDHDDLLEELFQICYNSKRWVKWVPRDYDPINNKLELIKICGHYILSDKKYEELMKRFSNISGINENEISMIIREKIKRYLKSLVEA